MLSAHSIGSATRIPGWLGPCPEFEILGPVVVGDAVAVMHGLVRADVATEDALDHQDVLEDIALLPAARVFRAMDHHVARMMLGAAALKLKFTSPT